MLIEHSIYLLSAPVNRRDTSSQLSASCKSKVVGPLRFSISCQSRNESASQRTISKSRKNLPNMIQYTEHLALMTQIAAPPSRIAQMLNGYSIEVNPSDSQALSAALDRLSSGTEVFLSWTPGTNPMHMLGPAARLRRAGLLPVPHVGASSRECCSARAGCGASGW